METLVPTVALGLEVHGPAASAPRRVVLCFEPVSVDALKISRAAVSIMAGKARPIPCSSGRESQLVRALKAIAAQVACQATFISPRFKSESLVGFSLRVREWYGDNAGPRLASLERYCMRGIEKRRRQQHRHLFLSPEKSGRLRSVASGRLQRYACQSRVGVSFWRMGGRVHVEEERHAAYSICTAYRTEQLVRRSSSVAG